MYKNYISLLMSEQERKVFKVAASINMNISGFLIISEIILLISIHIVMNSSLIVFRMENCYSVKKLAAASYLYGK